MAKASLVHEQQRVAERLVRTDNFRRRSHHLGKPCRLRVKPTGDNAEYDVAFGKNSNKAPAFNDHDCADILFCHQPSSFADEGPGRSYEDLSPLHHASDRLIEHRTSPISPSRTWHTAVRTS